jgi:sialate O-acetylesterase
MKNRGIDLRAFSVVRHYGTGLLAVLACSIFSVSISMAEVRLPAIIGDNMVLEQQAQAAIWGWADPGEKVTVTLDGKRAEAMPDTRGKWLARIPTPKAGGPYELTVEGTNKIVLKNVLIGEVWLCSGQSNMEISTGGGGAINAELPTIRLFKVARGLATKPREDLPEGKWVECTPATALDFSAVGYFFARDLQRSLHQPVGMIQCAVGGSSIGCWMSGETIEALPHFKETVKNGFPSGTFYNGMIAPIQPFTLRGALWYQGEAQHASSSTYAMELPALINAWREAWNDEKLAFLIVQLPRYAQPALIDWTLIREAQLKTAMTVPHTGLAVTIDVGDPTDLHPANKEVVGQRLALAAEAIAYGKDVPYSGPLFDSLKRDKDGSLRLSFKHVYGGLATPENQPLMGFEIAGADGAFRSAAARIAGKDVIVSSPDVPAPTAVRYGWANDPHCNLFNHEHLPASPFEERL